MRGPTIRPFITAHRPFNTKRPPTRAGAVYFRRKSTDRIDGRKKV
jgi:hypothetical protein